MVTTTNTVLIASAGTMSMTRNTSIAFSVSWGANLSPYRWSRVWAGLQPPGDADSAQSVAIQSEGSSWSLSNPSITSNLVTLHGTGNSGAAVVARIQLLASQADTF